MKQTVKKIMAEIFQLPEDQINTNSTIESVDNWDSLSQLTLIAGLEKEFNIKLSPEEMMRMTGFNKVIEILKKNVE